MSLTEQQLVWHRDNYSTNKRDILAYKKQHYENNKETILKKRLEYANKNFIKCLLLAAKARARKHNIEFSITEDNLILVTHCPILKIELIYHRTGSGRPSNNTASIDRLDSSQGYIPDNVQILSWRANNLKKDISLDEMRAMSAYYTKLIESTPQIVPNHHRSDSSAC